MASPKVDGSLAGANMGFMDALWALDICLLCARIAQKKQCYTTLPKGIG